VMSSIRVRTTVKPRVRHTREPGSVQGAMEHIICASQMTPRGVQLWLGTEAAPHERDTLVMSNLGYFQLKAQPGAWNLSLAPGERQISVVNTNVMGLLTWEDDFPSHQGMFELSSHRNIQQGLHLQSRLGWRS